MSPSTFWGDISTTEAASSVVTMEKYGLTCVRILW